jgi:uncharacterized protein (DUF1778 family)
VAWQKLEMRKDDVNLAVLKDLLRRILPSAGRCSVRRTDEGVSTQVYRIYRGDEVFYLRVAEEREASLAPEAHVHQLLHQNGVKAPEVVYFEPFNFLILYYIMPYTAPILGTRRAPMTMLDRPHRTSNGKQRTTKIARLEARASVMEKEAIQRAAELEGRTVSEFITSHAYKAAQQVIRAQDTMTLSARDSRAFAEALLNPPAANERLRSAFATFQQELANGTVQRT